MWGPGAGAHERTAPFPHLAGSLRIEGERGDRGRVHATVTDHVAKTLCEHAGLPGTRGRNHPRAASPMAHRRELVRCKVDEGHVVGDDREGSCLRVPAMDDAGATRKRRGTERSTIDVERRTVAEHDVSRAGLSDAVRAEGSGRLASVPPDGVTGPGVIVVRPDEELKALPREFEMRGQLVDRLTAVFLLAQRLRVDGQFHDHRPTLEPCLVECLQSGTGVDEGLVFDPDPREILPGLRSRYPGQHHHAAA